MTSALDRLIPTPRMVEVDCIDLAAPPPQVWELVRHGDLAQSLFVRALFALRTLPSRLAGERAAGASIRFDDLVSSPERPGFQILVDEPPHELAVGAIGKVWRRKIPFVHPASVEDFAAFTEAGFVKVAWAIRLSPLGEGDTRLTLDLRVNATDDESWLKFRRYFRVIGPGSRFIRRSLLAGLAHDLGIPESLEATRSLVGDEFLPDASAQSTDGVTIAARPEVIWPWLVQMGCRRAGFYSLDVLDNGGLRSAREIHAELQGIRVGDILPATPEGGDGFEVLRVEPCRALVLGGLYDPARKEQLPFGAPRPERYWHVTWAFVLEPLDERGTRLHVRARCAFPRGHRLHAAWIALLHRFMQHAQLRNLATRAEGRTPRDDWRDVAQGIVSGAIMAAALLTPFLRSARSHWGIDATAGSREFPGDDFVKHPRWGWTHGIQIDAPAEEVWSWVAQIGADRAGFYSYQWLENVAGCNLRNAETIRPEWEVHEGDGLSLHPEMPRLRVVSVVRGHHFVACGVPDATARVKSEPWVVASWLFLVEPLGDRRCRFVSRYRCRSSDDSATRLWFGPTLVEPISFAMDRRMLLGVKERAERRRFSAEPEGA